MTVETPAPISGIYFSQRLRLHYVDWGNPEAPPLLLIHGGRDHCRNWDWVASRLRHRWHVIAPDLRGHGDSAWNPTGTYVTESFLYDIDQLIHQQNLAPATIIAHSKGGSIALLYAGLYPEKVRKMAIIEGFVTLSAPFTDKYAVPMADRLRLWVDDQRRMAGRVPRRYPSIEAACARMREENPRLTHEQALHLTKHGINQNEDGTYTWKFDNYTHNIGWRDPRVDEMVRLTERITCPILMFHGADSWAPEPTGEAWVKALPKLEVCEVQNAGHWVHHDQLETFLDRVVPFLESDP